jgi:hypothetical protein
MQQQLLLLLLLLLLPLLCLGSLCGVSACTLLPQRCDVLLDAHFMFASLRHTAPCWQAAAAAATGA